MAQKQQEAAQKAFDECASNQNNDPKTGSCIRKPDGSVAYISITNQQQQSISGNNVPFLNIFGQSIGTGWFQCGGERQKACETTTQYFDKAVTNPTCATGLMPNAVGLCVRDPEYEKSLALSNYLKQNPDLTPQELETMMQQNLSSRTYLSRVTNNICGECNGQCVYSADAKKFTCASAGDVITYYANQDANKRKPGELEGSCYGLFGNPNLFGSCAQGLDCNNNGKCQLNDKELQAAAIQLMNKNNYQGQNINLSYFMDSSKISDALVNTKFISNLACDSSNPQYVLGKVVQCTDTTNKYIRTLPQQAMQNPSLFSVAGDKCRGSGGFCANDAGSGDKGGSDCPSGYSCHSNPAPGLVTTNDNGIKIGVQGVGQECDKELSNGATGQCVKGLRCWDYTCHDVTQLAYNPDYAKGYWATEAEKNPIGGIASGIMSSFNFDGMTNATNLQAQVFQDQMKKINQSNVVNVDKIYNEYYASLPSAVKGKVINLQWQDQTQQDSAHLSSIPDFVGNGIEKGVNWVRERGSDTGLFVGAYSSTFSNPYVETGETWTNPNSGWDKRLLDVGRSVAATAMPVVDVVSVGGGALVEKGGSVVIRAGGEIAAREASEQILKEGLVKGGASILADGLKNGGIAGLKDGIITVGKAMPRAASSGFLKGVGTGFETTAKVAIALTEASSKPFAGVLGVAGSTIFAPLHTPALWTAKALGNGLKALGEHGVPVLSKLTDKSIMRSVTEDAVASAIAKGEALTTGSTLTAAGNQALKDALVVAEQQGFHGTENAFRTAFEETAKHPPPQIIQAAVKNADVGLIDIVWQKASNLRGEALDTYIKNEVGDTPEAIAKAKGALQIVDFAKKWGLAGDSKQVQAVATALKSLANNDNPVIREQAEKLFRDSLANSGLTAAEIAAKSRTAVAGLLLDQSPYVVTAKDFLNGVSKDTAKKIASVQNTAEFQEFLASGNFPGLKAKYTGLPNGGLTDKDISELEKALINNNTIDTAGTPIDNAFRQRLKDIFQNDPALKGKIFTDENDVAREIVDQIYGKNFSANNIAAAKLYARSLVSDGTVQIEKTGLSGFIANTVDSVKGTLADTGSGIASLFNRSNKVNEGLDSLNTLVNEYKNRLRGGTMTQDEFNRLTSDTEIRRQLTDAGFNKKDADKILQQYHGIQGPGAGGINVPPPTSPSSNSVNLGRGDDGFFLDTISKKQAKAEFITDNTFKLTDIGSKNGTFIFDSSTNTFRSIQPGELVKIGDKLRFGPDQFVTVTKSRGGGIYLVDTIYGKALEIKKPSGIGGFIDRIFPDKNINSLTKLKPGIIPNKAEILTDIGSNYDSHFFHDGIADQQARIGFNKSSNLVSIEDLGSNSSYVYNKLTGQFDQIIGKVDTLSESDIVKLGNQQFIIGISPGKRVYLIDITTGEGKIVIDSSSVPGRFKDLFFNKNQYTSELKKYGEKVIAGTGTISTDRIDNAITSVRRIYRTVKVRDPSGKLVDSSVPFETLSVPSSDQRSLSAFKAKLNEIDDCIMFKCQTAVAKNFDARAQRMFGKSLNTLTNEEKIFLAAESLSVQAKIPAEVLLRVENLVNDDLNRLNRLAARSNSRFTPLHFEDVAPQAVGNRTMIWRAGPNSSAGVLGLNSGVDDIIFNADSLVGKSLQYQEHISTHEFIHSYQRMFKPYGYDIYNAYATYNEVFDEWLARRITNIPESEVKNMSYDIGVQRLNKLIRDKHLSPSEIQRLEDTALNGDFQGLNQWMRQNGFGDLRNILGDTSDYHFYTKSAR